jgi:hypothetical protein
MLSSRASVSEPVFVAAMERGLLPHVRADDQTSGSACPLVVWFSVLGCLNDREGVFLDPR